jgi:Protein of unknown function (DUF3826)
MFIHPHGGCGRGFRLRGFRTGSKQFAPRFRCGKRGHVLHGHRESHGGHPQASGAGRPGRSNRVHDVIVSQYRALKARDEVLNAAFGKDHSQRADLYQAISKPLHDQFLARLAAELTPEQLEKVKDKMTYGKVEFTRAGYCAIVPGFTDQDKAKIMELLKAAREEAMDGGSASEKTAIFQKYKDQINDYLNVHGHDVAQAYKEWNAKLELATKAKDESAPKAAQTQ